MGALPIALLTVVRYPRSLPDEDFTVLMEGIRDACRQVGTPNVGGDIGSAERITLSASAVGIVERGGSLLRTGARPGDRLCVTGATGVAASAQRYFGTLGSRSAKLPPAKERGADIRMAAPPGTRTARGFPGVTPPRRACGSFDRAARLRTRSR
ncbi:AIR synthase related protein [Spirillospora sp. NPDC046719]